MGNSMRFCIHHTSIEGEKDDAGRPVAIGLPLFELPTGSENTEEVLTFAEHACAAAVEVLSHRSNVTSSTGDLRSPASVLQKHQAHCKQEVERLLFEHEARVLEAVEQALHRFCNTSSSKSTIPSVPPLLMPQGYAPESKENPLPDVKDESCQTMVPVLPNDQHSKQPDVQSDSKKITSAVDEPGDLGREPNSLPPSMLSTPSAPPTKPEAMAPPKSALRNSSMEDPAKGEGSVSDGGPLNLSSGPSQTGFGEAKSVSFSRPFANGACEGEQSCSATTVSGKRRVSAIERNRNKQSITKDLYITKESKKKVFDITERQHAQREYCARLVHSSRFESFITIMIILNSGLIGLQMDYMAENGRTAELPTYLRIMEWYFTILFTIELALRIGGEGRNFFMDKSQRHWAVMDTVIVASALIEQTFLILASQSESGDSPADGNVNIFAALRILRLVRVARSVRVMQFSRDLRQLVMGVINCIKPLLWALVLLTLVTFIFTVIIIEFSVDKFQEFHEQEATTTPPGALGQYPCEPADKRRLGGISAVPRMLMFSNDLDSDVASHMGLQEELQWYFGNVPRGMYTLLKAVSGGMNWGVASEPLKHISWFLLIFFCFYIVLVIFAVLNIVTSIFIENARKNAEHDKENLIWEEVQEHNWRGDSLRAMFTKADHTGSGMLSWEDFRNHFEDPIVRALARTLGLDVDAMDLQTLFDLFDVDGTGQIDLETFMAGCMHLRGPATSVDMTQLRQEVQQMAEIVNLNLGQAGMDNKDIQMLSSSGVYRNSYKKEVMNLPQKSSDGGPKLI